MGVPASQQYHRQASGEKVLSRTMHLTASILFKVTCAAYGMGHLPIFFPVSFCVATCVFCVLNSGVTRMWLYNYCILECTVLRL